MLSVAKCMNTRRKLSKVDTLPGHAEKQGEVEMKSINPDLKKTKLNLYLRDM